MEGTYFGSAHHDEDEAHGVGQGDEDLGDREAPTFVARVVDDLLFRRRRSASMPVRVGCGSCTGDRRWDAKGDGVWSKPIVSNQLQIIDLRLS